jgi:AcrR family transcriptional regulator
MGLREQRKKRTAARILDSVGEILERKGYAEFCMADLARTAGVSVGTLYNYHKDKDDILLAYTRRHMTSCFERARTWVSISHESGQEAILGLLEIYLNGLMELDRQMLGTVQRVSVERNVMEADETRLSNLVTTQLKGLLSTLKDEGLIDPGVEVDAVSLILFSFFSDLVFQFSRDPGFEPEMVRDTLRRCLALVYSGIRRRGGDASPKAGLQGPFPPAEVIP